MLSSVVGCQPEEAEADEDEARVCLFAPWKSFSILFHHLRARRMVGADEIGEVMEKSLIQIDIAPKLSEEVPITRTGGWRYFR